jgi:hypothetical protein
VRVDELQRLEQLVIEPLDEGQKVPRDGRHLLRSDSHGR